MNGKERLLAALNGQVPDSVPVAPCYPNLYLRPYQWQAYLDAYRKRMGQRTEHPLSPEEDNEILFQSRMKALEAWQESPDWVGVSTGPSAAVQARSTLRLANGEMILVDEQAGKETNLTLLARGESNTLLRDRIEEISRGLSQDRAAVDALVPVESGQNLLESGSYQVAGRMIQACGARLFTHSVLSTPYSGVQYVAGFYGMMVLMKKDPDLLHYILERRLRAALPQLEAWAALGVDGVWLQEVFSGADTISPAAFDRFVFPTTLALIQACQALGMKAIYYPCGDIVPRLPRIVEMAPDALAFEESKKTFVLDVGRIRRAVGDELCLFGNVDAYGVLEIGNDQTLRSEITRQLAQGSVNGSRFVMSIGSPITPGTSAARVGAFVRMCRETSLHPSRPTLG